MLVAVGASRKAPHFVGWGGLVLGFMLLVTPLAWYLYQVLVQGDAFRMTAMDVLLLAGMAFFGGAIACATAWLFLPPRREAGKR